MPESKPWIENVSADDLVTVVARRSLNSRLSAVQSYLPLAAGKAAEDVEYVHKLRVWTRRAAAAVEMFEELLPRRQSCRLKRQLKKIRQAADKARDADVLAAKLLKEPDNPDAAFALKRDLKRRRKAQKPIMRVNKKLNKNNRFARSTKKLLSRVRYRPEVRSVSLYEPSFDEWSNEKLQPFVRRFFKAADKNLNNVDALHRFRIRGKQLRYAMELLAGAFPPVFRDEIYPQIKKLQNYLGRIHDNLVAQVRYHRWIKQADSEDERESLERMISADQDRVEQSLERFLRWWTPDREQNLREQFSKLNLKQEAS